MADGNKRVASLTDTEALALFKQPLALFGSPECPITQLPQQFCQPAEALAAYDAFKAKSDAALPGDSKQVVSDRAAQRKLFNGTMGDLVDTIELAARKDPTLPVKFGIDALGQGKGKTASKMAALLVPVLALKAFDREQGAAQCKVHGGARKPTEVSVAYDDPTNEANWQHFDSFFTSAFWLRGLTSGRRAYLRGRYIFGQDKKGSWSEMASIMVP